MDNSFQKIKLTVIASIMSSFLIGCSAQNVDAIKLESQKTIEQSGFEIIGYEGYEWTGFGRWGGCVWYTMRKNPDNGITYHGCISKWDNEYHIYNLSAIDAIGPKQ